LPANASAGARCPSPAGSDHSSTNSVRRRPLLRAQSRKQFIMIPCNHVVGLHRPSKPPQPAKALHHACCASSDAISGSPVLRSALRYSWGYHCRASTSVGGFKSNATFRFCLSWTSSCLRSKQLFDVHK